MNVLRNLMKLSLRKARKLMAEKLDEKELVSFKEMLIANSIQVDAVAQLQIEKGVFSEEEFHTKLSQVVHDYREKQEGKMA
jgi:hypothetical protein